MKKLMTMIAAVAMSFGLFADAYTIAFEAVDTAKGVDTTAGTFTTQSPWSPASKVMTLVDSDAAAQTEAYGSGEKARRAFGSADQTKDLKIAGEEVTLTAQSGDVFLDQLVKFTGFDEAPDFTTIDDMKVAVWMSEFENNDETTETNLFVTCYDATNDKTESFQIDGTFELDKWYRVTVRNIGKIGKAASSLTARAGFVVYINGDLASSAAAKEVYPAAEMTEKAKAYMAQGQLFPAIDTTDIAFKSVTFKGQGEVDDIIVDAEGPAFAQDVEFTLKAIAGVDHFVVSNGTVEVAADDGTYTVKKGATVDIYAIPAEGKFVNPASAQRTVTASGEIDLEEDFSVDPALAKVVIDEDAPEYFLDLAAAIAAAEQATGESIVVTALEDEQDAEYDGFTITIPKNGTITITGTKAWAVVSVGLEGVLADREIEAGVVTLTDDLTINNATLNAEEVAVATYGITLKGSGTLVTTSDLTVASGDEGKIVKKDGPNEDWYTYTLVDPLKEVELTIEETNATVAGVVEGTVTEGSNITFTVTAAEGYKNPTATVEGAKATMVEPGKYTFTVEKADIKITATADAKAVYTVTFTTNGCSEVAFATKQVTEGEKLGTFDTPAAIPGYTGAWDDPAPTTEDVINVAKTYNWTYTKIAVTEVTLDFNELTMNVNDVSNLVATVKPDTAVATVVWASDAEGVATVDQTGAVMAVAAGTANITATADGKTATCVVTVKSAEPETPGEEVAKDLTGTPEEQAEAATVINEMCDKTSATAAEVKTWLDTFATKPTAAEIAEAKSLDVSYQLGAQSLFTAEPKAEIKTFAQADEAAESMVGYNMTFEIKGGTTATPADTDAVKAYIATLVQANESVDFEGTAISVEPVVTVSGTTISAKVELPADKAAAFMKVETSAE